MTSEANACRARPERRETAAAWVGLFRCWDADAVRRQRLLPYPGREGDLLAIAPDGRFDRWHLAEVAIVGPSGGVHKVWSFGRLERVWRARRHGALIVAPQILFPDLAQARSLTAVSQFESLAELRDALGRCVGRAWK